MNALEPLVTIAGIVSFGVFVLAFKFAVNEACTTQHRRYEPDLPQAELRKIRGGTGRRWLRGASKQRIIRHIPVLQAGLVAFGITAIFIMFLCMAGVLVTVTLLR